MGVIFSRDDDGKLGTRAFGGQKKARTYFVGAITGSALLLVLYDSFFPLIFLFFQYEYVLLFYLLVKGIIEKSLDVLAYLNVLLIAYLLYANHVSLCLK